VLGNLDNQYQDNPEESIIKRLNNNLKSRKVFCYGGEVESAFQIANKLRLKDIYIMDSEVRNTDIYVKKTNKNVHFCSEILENDGVYWSKTFQPSNIDTIQIITSVDDVINCPNIYLYNIPFNKIGLFISLLDRYTSTNVLSCSFDRSICSGRVISFKNLQNTIKSFSQSEQMADEEILQKAKSGTLSFYDLEKIFNQVINQMDQFKMIANQFNLNATDVINNLKKQLACCRAMTQEEKNDYKILDESRINRISKGTKVPSSQIYQLIKMMQYLSENGTTLEKLSKNPSEMQAFLKRLKG